MPYVLVIIKLNKVVISRSDVFSSVGQIHTPKTLQILHQDWTSVKVSNKSQALREILIGYSLAHLSRIMDFELDDDLGYRSKSFVDDPSYDTTQHLFNFYRRLR